MIGAVLIAFGLCLGWLYWRLDGNERRNAEQLAWLDARLECLERLVDPWENLGNLKDFGARPKPKPDGDK